MPASLRSANGGRRKRFVDASHDAPPPVVPGPLAREQKEWRDALFEAAQLHRKLCSPREARRGPFEVVGEMFAVRHLSGDFLRVFDLGSSLGLALGDIAGKGLSASLWVAHILGLVRIYFTEQAELPAAMQSINRELCQALPSAAADPMVALFLARLDPYSSELEYCNAGQPAPLLLSARTTGNGSSGVELLPEGGPVLGVLPEATFTCGRVFLQPGDTLAAYSDGVVETRRAVRAYSSGFRVPMSRLRSGRNRDHTPVHASISSQPLEGRRKLADLRQFSFIRSTKERKRGSERSGSRLGSTFRRVRKLSRCW
jgi:sigma-B regulation protein RsbU (phosphoserine phosphatase)